MDRSNRDNSGGDPLDEKNYRGWITGITVALLLVLSVLLVLSRSVPTDIATTVPKEPTTTSSIVIQAPLTPANMTSAQPNSTVPATQGRP